MLSAYSPLRNGLFHKIIAVKASGGVRYEFYGKMLDFVLRGLLCEIRVHIIL